MANFKTGDLVKELTKNTKTLSNLELLSDTRKALINECLKYGANKEIAQAREELDAAREKFNRLSTAYCLTDSEYCQFQTEIVRAAVHEFSRVHGCKGFATWFDRNDKDVQTTVIDSVNRLASEINRLYSEYIPAAKVARKKALSSFQLKGNIYLQRFETEIDSFVAFIDDEESAKEYLKNALTIAQSAIEFGKTESNATWFKSNFAARLNKVGKIENAALALQFVNTMDLINAITATPEDGTPEDGTPEDGK